MATYIKLCRYALMIITLAFIIIISSAVAIPSGNNDDMVMAIEEMEKANYFTFVMLINMLPPNLFQGNITFLMPSDRSLSRTTIPQNSVVNLLLNHSIPSPLLFDHLLHLPTNTTLPTSNPNLRLKVSNGGRREFSLGNVRIVSPNICTRGFSVRCHGIDDVLSIDLGEPAAAGTITCPRVATSPIPSASPLLAPPNSPAPAASPPLHHADASETSSGGRPHMELALTICMAFMWVLLYNKAVCLI